MTNLQNSDLFHFVIYLFVLTSFCAKKLPPPSPDRFRPALKKIETIDRLHLRLKFSEPIDTKSLIKDDFTITTDSATLPILSVSLGDEPSNLLILTEPQKPIPYELAGLVHDTAGNVTSFKKKFFGSTQPDTIPPRITTTTPGLSALRVRRAFTIRLSFSEPIDTTEAPVYTLLPLPLKNRISFRWASDQTSLSFVLSDSLGPDTTVYFVLAPTLTDLERNGLLTPGFTVFTTDTVLPPTSVSGTLKYETRPVRNGIIMFYRNGEPLAAAVSDYSGGFSLPLLQGEYLVKAFADTVGRGEVQLFIEIPTFNTEAKNLEVELKPVATPLRLDEFFK